MAESLDKRVAQAVLDASLLERALHDTSAQWGMRWRGYVAPAERVVSVEGVTFYASFPTLADDGDRMVYLVLNGDEVRSREIVIEGPMALDLDWSLALDDRTVLTAQ